MGKKSNQSPVDFVRLVRQRPFILAIFAGMGLIVGCCCLVLVPNYDNKADKYFFLCFGVGCIIFYGGLLIFLFNKIRSKSWVNFCDRTIIGMEQIKQKKLTRNAQSNQSMQAFYERNRKLLVWASAILALLMLASCFFLDLSSLFIVIVLAPAFFVVISVDIFKAGLTLNRVLALLFSAAAMAVVAARVYIRIHNA
jgi:hypothetical protein